MSFIVNNLQVIIQMLCVISSVLIFEFIMQLQLDEKDAPDHIYCATTSSMVNAWPIKLEKELDNLDPGDVSSEEDYFESMTPYSKKPIFSIPG